MRPDMSEQPDAQWLRDLLPLIDGWEPGAGLAEHVVITVPHFLERAAAIFDRAPSLVHLKFREAHGRCSELAASPYMSRLKSIDLESNHLDDRDAMELAASTNLRGLCWLNLNKNDIGQPGIEAIAAATTSNFPSLRYLGLWRVKAEDPRNQPIEWEGGGLSWQQPGVGYELEKKYGTLLWLHPLDRNEEPEHFYRTPK